MAWFQPLNLKCDLLLVSQLSFKRVNLCRYTAEMDPGTFDQAQLDQYVALGVTRVSLGVQSFDAGVLKTAGRAHTVEVGSAVRLLNPVQLTQSA
jgi:coproporphyrinogen III oxidase-like Fe-S oxidoreductase